MTRLAIGCAVAIVAIAIITSQIVRTVSLEGLRPLLEEELSEAFGLEVRLESPPQLQLTPGLEMSIEGVRFANLPGRPSPHLLEVDRLRLDLRLLPLLRRKLVIDSLELVETRLYIEPDAAGSWDLHPDLEEIDEREDLEPDDPFVLAIHEIEIDGMDVFFDRVGESDVTTLHLDRFVARSQRLDQPLEIEAHGELEGSRFQLEASTGSVSEFLEPSQAFPVDLRAKLRDGELRVLGTLGDPRTLEGMALRVTVTIADLANGAQAIGIDLPPLGAVDVTGMLVGRDGALGIEELVVRSRGEAGLDVEFEGEIADLRKLEGVDVHMRVAAGDIDLFRQLTRLSLPGVPLVADLELEDRDGSLGLSGKGEIARPGFFELDVAGGFGDLRGLADLDVRVGFMTSTVESIFDAFARDASWRLPDLGPLEASGRFVLREGRLGLDEIEVTLGNSEQLTATLVGSVTDVLGIEGVMLDARIQAVSASQIAARFERAIPEVGPLDAMFTIRDSDGSLGIESATARIGGDDRFSLLLSGEFDDLRDLEEGTLEVSLEAGDLSLVGGLFDVDLPEIGPVSFAGVLEGSRAEFSSRGRVQLNQTMIQGQLELRTPPGSRPSIVVEVESPRIHLPDLLSEKRRQGRGHADGEGAQSNLAQWWRGERALPVDRLHGFDAVVSIEAARVTGYEALDLEDFRVAARVEDGQLRLEDFGAEYEGGRVSGRMSLDARPVVPQLALEMEAFNVDLTLLMSQLQESSEYAGYLDLSVRLTTQGSRPYEMRSNLGGVFGAMLREGSIVNEYSKAITLNVLRLSIPSFSVEDAAEAPVHCLLALMPIDQGVARVETLYLEGQKITIVGEGSIDLARDELALRLTPRLHEPGLLSVATTIDVSGPIESPDIDPLRRSMMTSALGAIYRNALRPFTALGRLAFGRDDDANGEVPDPCGAIARQRIAQMQTPSVEPIELDRAAQARDTEPAID